MSYKAPLPTQERVTHPNSDHRNLFSEGFCQRTTKSNRMSRVGQTETEIEMQEPTDEVERASATPENSHVQIEKVTDETAAATKRKANEFRGRQVQMMAISLRHCRFMWPLTYRSRYWLGTTF